MNPDQHIKSQPFPGLRYRVIDIEPWYMQSMLRVKAGMAFLVSAWAGLMVAPWLASEPAGIQVTPTPLAVADLGHAPLAKARFMPPRIADMPSRHPMPAISLMQVVPWPGSVMPAPQVADAGLLVTVSPRRQPARTLQEPHWLLAVYRPQLHEAEIQAYLQQAIDSLAQGQSLQARLQLQSVLSMDPDRIEAVEQLWQLSQLAQDRYSERYYADKLQALLPDYFTGPAVQAVSAEAGQE